MAHPPTLPTRCLSGKAPGSDATGDQNEKPRAKGFDVGLKEQEPTAPLRGGNITQPTFDQLYLAERINDTAPKGRLSPAAIQKLNSEFGVRIVSDALRFTRGFPPAELRSPYPYVRRICQRQLEEWT